MDCFAVCWHCSCFHCEFVALLFGSVGLYWLAVVVFVAVWAVVYFFFVLLFVLVEVLLCFISCVVLFFA